MRNLITPLLLILGIQCYSQSYFAIGNYKDMVNLNDTRYGVPVNKIYTVGGEDVYGSPFLYEEWYTGRIELSDGRMYDNYLFKYNALEQAVHFKSGNDSLQVVDPVSEFTLIADKKDSSKVYRFVTSSRFWKKDGNSFYEVLYEDPQFMLLKKNQKIVSRNAGNLPSIKDRKFFDLELTYFIYNKKQLRIDKMKMDGSNFLTLLGATYLAPTIAENQWKLMNEEDRSKIAKLAHSK